MKNLILTILLLLTSHSAFAQEVNPTQRHEINVNIIKGACGGATLSKDEFAVVLSNYFILEQALRYDIENFGQDFKRKGQLVSKFCKTKLLPLLDDFPEDADILANAISIKLSHRSN